MWVQFWDMHSGGDLKWRDASFVYIEADDAISARETFERITGRNPDNVTCDTCGEDYSVSAAKGLDDFRAHIDEHRQRKEKAIFIDRNGVEIQNPLKHRN